MQEAYADAAMLFDADDDGTSALDPTTAVIAHSLISSVAVVSSAIQSLIAFGDDLEASKRDELLKMALTQAEYLSEVLKDMARGLPPEVIEALDAISERRPFSDA
jgi:hypothetical protein